MKIPQKSKIIWYVRLRGTAENTDFFLLFFVLSVIIPKIFTIMVIPTNLYLKHGKIFHEGNSSIFITLNGHQGKYNS